MQTRPPYSLFFLAFVLVQLFPAPCLFGLAEDTNNWNLIFEDDFSYPSAKLSEHWKAMSSASWNDESAAVPFSFSDKSPWRTDRDTLYGVNQNGIFDNITCTVPFYGDIRVDWVVVSEKDNLNYNCFMSGDNRWQGYMFHVAAFGDPLRCALTLGANDNSTLASARLAAPLPVRQPVHLRMEYEGNTIRLFVESTLVIQYVDPYPRSTTSPVYFGFENNLNNIQRIDGVRVHVKKPAAISSPPVLKTNQTGARTSVVLTPSTNGQQQVLIDFETIPEDRMVGKWNIRLSPFSDSADSRNNSEWSFIPVNEAALPAGLKFNRCLGLNLDIQDSTIEDYASFSPIEPLSDILTPDGQGVLHNVGLIKSITVTIRGGNAGHGLELRLRDQYHRPMTVRFGTLDFIGWRKLVWENPMYNQIRRDRALTRPAPPPLLPLTLVLDSLVVYKAYFESQGHFVGYIKDIRIEYDPAAAPQTGGSP